MTLHSSTENSLVVLNHKILEANSKAQNVKLGGHQTCLSINRLWHELCDMLRRLVGTKDTIAYIKLSLVDEQALQFAAEANAKVLWDKIRATFIGRGEDQKVDADNELKNILMKNGETVG
ncbi:hypothetical protein TNCV_2523671 [Trichonephila clavipes]|nr:hypothetical protein TNCV_2523671 [Trichonephila clavipes]